MTASSFTPDLLPSEDNASQTQFTKFWQSFENNFLMCPRFPLGADVFPTDFYKLYCHLTRVISTWKNKSCLKSRTKKIKISKCLQAKATYQKKRLKPATFPKKITFQTIAHHKSLNNLDLIS